MALLGTLVLIVLLVAIRLLLPPMPRLVAASRMFGKRTAIILCTIGIAGGVVLIALSRH